MRAKAQRLAQALKHFQETTKGEELPKGTEEAVKGLLGTLEGGTPERDTPGGRAAMKVAPGTDGTGEPFQKAVVGVDGPSPGQRQARSVSKDIEEAAEAIAAGK